MTSIDDARYARAALEAAEEGTGQASPNPLVGTVIVRDGEIVGSGTHRYADRKHAEVVALDQAGERAKGATVYVNLEPCSHHGRTPPCVDALIEAGVARVVASMKDPASYVNGRGFEILRAAGIDVSVGIEHQSAERLNERYLKFITTGRPFVLLKVAETLDGRVATRTGESRWITGEGARNESQMLRRAYDAILVGVGTIVADDPELTYRGGLPKRVPIVRAVLDPTLRTPVASRVIHTARSAPVVIYTTEEASHSANRSAFEKAGVDVVTIASDRGALDLGEVLDDLGTRGVNGVIVEGGPETSSGFVASRLVDKVTFFVAPRILGGRDSRSSIGGAGPERLADALGLEHVEVRRLGDDIEITGYPARADSRDE